MTATIADMSALTIRELADITGGLSRPSKMPGCGYSLPARECQTGTRLRAVPGSTCEHCYAMRGNYGFPNVQSALYRRLAALEDPRWAGAMAELIRRQSPDWFRWHDSGDLQSVAHLSQIVDVCHLTSDTRHWLPTREYRIVAEYRREHGGFPRNLTVRMSAHMIGGRVPAGIGLPVSSVNLDGDGIHVCPASHQGNACGDCRACWDPDTRHVSYPLH